MDAASDTIKKLNSAKNDLFKSGLDSMDTRGTGTRSLKIRLMQGMGI